MLAVVKPSPLRLWGFLLTAIGGALIAFGSIESWATITLGGSTHNAVPTKGIDLWQGKVTVLVGAMIVIGILALRFVRPERRNMIGILLTVAAALCLGIAAWCLVSLESVIHGTGIDALTKHVADVLGISEAQARRAVVRTMQLKGIHVRAQTGLWMAAAGGVLGTVGGFVDLAWVRQKRIAGNAIDPDTLPARAEPEA
jgi:hypothetical protein